MFRSRLPLLIAQKEHAERRKITHGEIAAEAGLSRATVSKWMSQGAMPRLDAETVQALCKYLGCTLSDLVEVEPGQRAAAVAG